MRVFEGVIEKLKQGAIEAAADEYLIIVNEEGKPLVETKTSAKQIMQQWYAQIRKRVLTRREKGE